MPMLKNVRQCSAFEAAYTFIGRDNIIIADYIDVCVIAKDFIDVVHHLESFSGRELTKRCRSGKTVHNVIEKVVIQEIRLVGPLRFMTAAARKLLNDD